MKKTLIAILTLALALTGLTACGKKGAAKDVDLSEFWSQLESEIELPGMIENSDELISYYPGLEEITLTQSVIKVPMMTAVVNEYVFLQCENEEDAAKAAEILQTRVTQQADGGAWYPASVEAWSKAQVVTNGTYVAMVAAGDDTQTVVDKFNALFA